MSVLSIRFVIFLIVAYIVYYIFPKRYQWISLLCVSYCFYAFAGLKAIFFILLTSITAFFAGKAIGKINDEYEVAIREYKGPNPKITRAEKGQIKAEEDKRKRRIMILVLILNFGLLIVLKYSQPIADMFNSLCSVLHIQYEIPQFSMIIPLGISYYTFQAMGYIIDLYRRKYSPEKNLAHFMLFISFFPQLIQGPISRYDEFADQLFEPHRFDYTRLKHGIELSMWGLFKKLVISDRIAIITTAIFADPDKYGGFYLFIAAMLSMLQLYTDFSGGIDITRGVAEGFGIVMPENFVRPFFATTLSEYWRRWHITLNNWWRDYIFYPLTLSKPLTAVGKVTKKIFGDNIGKKMPVILSLIVIRFINSIWHGASPASVICGLYYGVTLALAFVLEPQLTKLDKALKINTECLTWKVFQCVRTFVLIAFPRLIVNAGSLTHAGEYLRALFTTWNPWILFDHSLFSMGVSQSQFYVLVIALLFLLLISYVQEKGYIIREELDKQNTVFRGMIYIAFLVSIILFGVYGSGYNAGAFIYQQF